MPLRTSVAARNAALTALAAQANNGIIRIYTGAQPATPETAASGTLLASATMGATAFGAASGGTITANAITGDSAIDNTGTAGWFRLFQSDGTTPIFDGDITTTGGGGVMTMPTTSLVQNATFSISALSYSLPQ